MVLGIQGMRIKGVYLGKSADRKSHIFRNYREKKKKQQESDQSDIATLDKKLS